MAWSLLSGPAQAGDWNGDLRDDVRCLALNIYHEARSEPFDGRVAVGAVTLNRVDSPHYPDRVCDVVRQGGERRKFRCQFSWWCDGKSDKPRDTRAWVQSWVLALYLLDQEFVDPTGGATHYHANYVRPKWADRFIRMRRIGRHIFYQDNRTPLLASVL